MNKETKNRSSNDLSLTFHGAARTTTGSRHLLSLDGARVLFDCGLYQGRRAETWERNHYFGFDPASLHCVLLSHAHIDHSGNLPNLVRQEFQQPIYCTPATADLCRIMLRDSAFIQEKDAEWLRGHLRKHSRDRSGKGRGRSSARSVPSVLSVPSKGAAQSGERSKHNDPRSTIHDSRSTPPKGPRSRSGATAIEPLYTMEDAERSLRFFQSVDYHRSFNVAPGVEAVFQDAGHILGSASVTLNIQRGNSVQRLAFSGDIGRVGLPLLRDPEIPSGVDWLLMEGTYGARTHDPIAEAKEELRQTITRVAARGGKIIVPSFAIERTQEIIYYLSQLYNENHLPQIPVYVDSPLAINATEVFRLHTECFDEETRKILLHHNDPFNFNRLTYVRDVEESKRLNSITFPCMIISASGMCEAGRILHHLRNSIEDPKNCIMFVGYQAEGTLGRKIVERQSEVNIFGEPHRLRAEVVTLNTMSGHADKNELYEYARAVKAASPNLKTVFLIHGEEAGLNELGARLRDGLGLNVVIPQPGEKRVL